MLGRLLESRGRPNRSMWGAALSTLAHTTLIAIAVFATAEARVEQPDPPEIITWVNPPAPRTAAAPSASTPAKKVASIPRVLDVPDRIEVATTPVDLVIDVPAPGRMTSGDVEAGVSSLPSSGSGEVTDLAGPFSADRVERQAYLESGSVAPRYPRSLRAAGIEGGVTAVFVVNETGRVERESLRFTRSDNPLFEAAVRDALQRMRFIAAEVGGVKVRQLVQMPFVFTLDSTQ